MNPCPYPELQSLSNHHTLCIILWKVPYPLYYGGVISTSYHTCKYDELPKPNPCPYPGLQSPCLIRRKVISTSYHTYKNLWQVTELLKGKQLWLVAWTVERQTHCLIIFMPVRFDLWIYNSLSNMLSYK